VPLNTVITDTNLGLITDIKGKAVKPTEDVIKAMLNQKYPNLKTEDIKVSFDEKAGVAVISSAGGNYVKSVDMTFKVALELYVESSLDEPLDKFMTPDDLKALIQKQNGDRVDLSQTEIVSDSNLLKQGIIVLRVKDNSKLYDTTDKYREVQVSYKYRASSLMPHDLGIFNRFPTDSDINVKLQGNSKTKGTIELKQLNVDINHDGTITFTVKDDSALYVPGDKFTATFQVKLNEITLPLGTISPIKSFTDKDIFQRIMDTNSPD